jgi:type IV secretory pathway component VirB8
MVGCQHCENLAAEMTATRAIVERLEKTLLGNGQPGRCAEHAVRIARLERWRSWIAGALAVIGLLWAAAVTVVAAVVVEGMKQ